MSDVSRLKFTFEQCLGKGGFGEVYLTTLHKPGGLRQKVAVKVLKEDVSASEDAVKRLRDEARLLTTLNHPAILRAHELARVSGRIALVTEYVEGIDLSLCCRGRSLLPHRVLLGVIAEVAGALDAAWNTPSPETANPLHLIHRDVKPENIRIGVHGQVKLLDFGVARTSELERNAKTQIGHTPFTPGYAAPETFSAGKQGPESDVYALGVTLYRAIAGQRFYEGMDLAAQVQTAAFPDDYEAFLDKRLGELDIDERIHTLLQVMLAFRAADRPMASQVREICEHLADELKGPTLSRWVRQVDFPPPRNVAGASLTGQTLTQDDSTSSLPVGPVFGNVKGGFKLPGGMARPSPKPAPPKVEPLAAPAPPPPPATATSSGALPAPPPFPGASGAVTANPAAPRFENLPAGFPAGLKTVAPRKDHAAVVEETTRRRRRQEAMTQSHEEVSSRRTRRVMGVGLVAVLGMAVVGGTAALLALAWVVAG